MKQISRRAYLAPAVAALAAQPQKSKQPRSNALLSKFRIFNPATMHKPTGYSHVAEITSGKVVYIAGQVAMDPAGNLVGKDDLAAQTKQVFANLKAALEAVGADFSHVVKLNSYCAAPERSSAITVYREIRNSFVSQTNPPPSTFVFIPSLATPEYLIEVEAICVV